MATNGQCEQYITSDTRCGEATDCGDIVCGHLCATHEAEYQASMDAEDALMRCPLCGTRHPEDAYPEWNAIQCAERIEARREAAEDAARSRGFTAFMRAAQYGAPEAYRF